MRLADVGTRVSPGLLVAGVITLRAYVVDEPTLLPLTESGEHGGAGAGSASGAHDSLITRSEQRFARRTVSANHFALQVRLANSRRPQQV
jgi:hypothetical protein